MDTFLTALINTLMNALANTLLTALMNTLFNAPPPSPTQSPTPPPNPPTTVSALAGLMDIFSLTRRSLVWFLLVFFNTLVLSRASEGSPNAGLRRVPPAQPAAGLPQPWQQGSTN